MFLRRARLLGVMVYLALAPAGAALAADGGTAPEAQPGFSLLDQLTPANVGGLRPVASISTGSRGAHGAAPVIAGDTAFILTPFPHELLALDLGAPGLPVKWRYRPAADSMAAGQGSGARNAPVVADGRVFLTTLDGHAIALDAATGAVLWDMRVADLSQGETLPAPPLVARGSVLLGSGGDDFGARGWIAALSAETGRLLWKRYSTGPDDAVGIGPGFASAGQGQDLGVATWPPSAWQHGGGGVSGLILWDAAAGLVFHGTGHPAPWNPDQRRGDNRWTSGLFARALEDGAARWFLPVSPHDLYAMGSTTPNLLLDREWQGRQRPLLVHPDANGHVYVLDRLSGALLSAEAFLPVNATEGLDPEQGLLRRNPAKAVRSGGTTTGICPAHPGAVGGAAAYSPRTGLLYIPGRRLCMDLEARDTTFMPGTPFTGANLRQMPAPGLHPGALVAWDLGAARIAWTHDEALPLEGGALATAGGLVFYGTAEGVLKALDAGTGAELWRFQAASGIIAPPVSYQGPDGRQYVAVLAGTGGFPGAVAGREIDIRDATAAEGRALAMRRLPQPPDTGGMLYVFGLP
jgi:PQQ-dependent dehydrogenase (methanol/ethanol family)